MTTFTRSSDAKASPNPGNAAIARAAAVLPLALLLLLTFLLGCFEMGNYDIWWHLRTGQLIPSRGVPVTDWYGFVSDGNTWIDVHWGFQLLMAWVYEMHGVAGMILTKASVGVAAVLICLLAYQRRWSTTVQILVWLPALLLMSSRLYVRPETFTLFFTACFLCILFHAEKYPKLLWLLPFVQAIWANFQGLFIFGPILLGMYLVEAILRLNHVRGLFRHLIPVSVLVAIACCISPYKIANVLFVFELWTRMRPEGQFFRENVAELMDLTTFLRRGGHGNEYLWMLVALLVLSAVSVVVAWKEILIQRRVFRLLPLVAFGWLSWQATRNGNHFALVAGTVICWNFGSVLGERQIRWSMIGFQSALVLAVMYLVAHGDWYQMVGGHRHTGLGIRKGFHAHQAMRYAGQKGMPDRAAIFHMGHAATYIFENGPDKKVLMDGRLEVHSPQAFQEYVAIQEMFKKGDDWNAALQAKGVGVLIIDSEHNHLMIAAALQHPQWRCVYCDEVVCVFLRRDIAMPEGVAEFDFRHWLFDGRLPLFRSPLPKPMPPLRWWLFPPAESFPDTPDFLSERLYHISLAINPRQIGGSSLQSVMLLCSMKHTQLAIRRRPWVVEPYRLLGAQQLQLAEGLAPEGIPKVTDAWQNIWGTLVASAVHRLQLALDIDEDDYSSRFYLQQVFSQIGVRDASLEHLEHLLTLPADNPARIELRPRLQETALQRKTELETARKQIDPENLTFAGLTQHAQAGFLASGLRRIEPATVSHLSPEQIDRIGTWFLITGQVEQAKQVYAKAEALPAALKSLRLGCCEQVAGEFEQARQLYLRVIEGTSKTDPLHADALGAIALLNVLATDLHQARIYTQRLEEVALTPNHRHLVRWLGGLFPRAN